MRRELSLEERCTFSNLLADVRLTGIPSRYTPTGVRSMGIFVNAPGLTVEQLHERFDSNEVPRYTNNPYQVLEIEDFLNSQSNRLWAAQVQEDMGFQYTADTFLEHLLEKSLAQQLVLKDRTFTYTRYEEGGESLLTLQSGDMLVRRPLDQIIYAYWLAPKDGESDVSN